MIPAGTAVFFFMQYYYKDWQPIQSLFLKKPPTSAKILVLILVIFVLNCSLLLTAFAGSPNSMYWGLGTAQI